MPTRITLCLAVTMSLAAANVGCQGRIGGGQGVAKLVDIPSGIPWKQDKEPKPGIPARVVVTWTDAVLQQSGRPAERGFGGRLFFYDGKDPQPIPVEGQLVVYAFDETGRKPTDNRPTRRYVFPAEHFAKHQSESEFGLSYSVWLPWGSVDGPTTDVSLIARFEPLDGGKLVVSDQSQNRLPGRMDVMGPAVETSIASQTLTPTIQQASHTSEAPASAKPAEPRRRLETTSIKLPPRRPRLGASLTAPGVH